MRASSIASRRPLRGSAGFRRIGILDGLDITDAMREALAEASREPVATVRPGSPAATEVDCLLAGWQHQLDESLLAGLPALRLVLLRATSRDRIDEEALRRRGIELAALGRYGDESTTEFVVAEMLGHFRGDPAAGLPRELAGRTLGLVGMGAIATLVARAAQGLGMDVVYSARTPDREPRIAGTQTLSTGEVLERADVLSVHTPPYTTVLTAAQLERSRAELLVVTTLGLPLPEEALVAWLELGRHAVLDLCAAQDAAARLRERGVEVRDFFAARSAGSVERAERQLLDQMRLALDPESRGRS